MLEHPDHQPQTASSHPASGKRLTAYLCLAAVIAIMLSAATGILCWQIRSRIAASEVEAAKQACMEEYDASRSSAYTRVVEAWNRTLADQYADAVFCGDSLTAGGDWGEWYPYSTCVTLGVVGDTVTGLHSRIGQVEMLMPEKCFVMIGINDLNYGGTADSALQSYADMLTDLGRIVQENGVTTYLLSVLPVREGEIVYPATNADVRLLNSGIAELAQQHGMIYVDLHAEFADEQGLLRQEYSFDGLHLNELGYYRWQELLAPYMEE